MDYANNVQDNIEATDEYNDVGYSQTHLIEKLVHENYINNNKDNDDDKYFNDCNKTSPKQHNLKIFRDQKNNYSNINSYGDSSITESNENDDIENEMKKDQSRKKNKSIEEFNNKEKLREKGNIFVTKEKKNDDDEDKQQNNRSEVGGNIKYMTISTSDTPKENINQDSFNSHNQAGQPSNINYNSINNNSDQNNTSINNTNENNINNNIDNNNNNKVINNNVSTSCQNTGLNKSPTVILNNEYILINNNNDENNSYNSNVNEKLSFNNQNNNSNHKNYNEPISNPFRDPSDHTGVISEIYHNNNQVDIATIPVKDIVDLLTENNKNNKTGNPINDEKSLKFNLTPDVTKSSKNSETIKKEENKKRNGNSIITYNNFGSSDSNSLGERTSVSSLYNSDKRYTSRYKIYSESSSSITVAFDTSREDTLTIYLFNNIYYIIVLYFMIIVSLFSISYSHSTTEWMSIYVNITSEDWGNYINSNTSISANYIEIYEWGLNKICLTEDVSSVTSPVKSNKKICTDKCVHAVCGHYTCLSMYDNIKEDDESLSIVFFHNLKSLFDYRPSNNHYISKDNDNTNIINGVNNYMKGNYKNSYIKNNSQNIVSFMHKNNIQARSVDYTNLNKIMNYNKTNYVVYNNDIVVEYNENPKKEVEQYHYPTEEDDENKIINIGILMDDDYIYEQMKSSNNYEISIDNYTYKFIQNGDSITQQQALSEPSEMSANIFDTDICTEIGKVEGYVNVCYSCEAIILFIFTLIIIKIIHYKRLTVSDEIYEDTSDFGSNSFYSLTGSERNESLPSVVNNPYSFPMNYNHIATTNQPNYNNSIRNSNIENNNMNINNIEDNVSDIIENENANDIITITQLKNHQPKSILKKSVTINNIRPMMKNSSKDLLGYNINLKSSEKPRRHATINERPSQRARKFSASPTLSGTNIISSNKLSVGVNKPVPKGILRNTTLRESALHYTNRDHLFVRERDSDFKLIKSNSADNLCNRSIQNNRRVILKNRLEPQEFIINEENLYNNINIGKEKEYETGEQIKILKTYDISLNETDEAIRPKRDTVIDIDPLNKTSEISSTKDEIKDIYDEPTSFVKTPLTKHLSTVSRRKSTFYTNFENREISSFSMSERGLNYKGNYNMSFNRLNAPNSQYFQQQQLRKQCRFSIIALSKDENNNGANIKIPLNNASNEDNNYIIGHSTDPSVLLNLNITKNSNSNKHSAVVVRKPTDLLKIGQTKFICYCYIIICIITLALLCFCIIAIISWTKIRTRSKVKAIGSAYSPDKMIVINVSLLHFVIGTTIQVVTSLIIIYSYIYSFNVIKKTLYKNE
ncbi:hypothetical protein BCR36DRAFT_408901 [Piromyces finnis]|uniref:Uncharacterized protein n=1 Tax=Piromyces finnis TaxID=1754191 RepID=A0A1Y1VJW4_9FUNG|nr:hypothetical protein BCR36DRAFT_408901 [Piromyces finnis]|eukprot:ORX58384.1 hypothetical protein BCR36DRAFT_408901 [Piromyces finnis]